MVEAFHQGGWGMIPTAFFGVLLVLASVRYAVSPERRFVPLQVSLGIMTLASGGLGFVTGLIKSVSTLETAKPDMRWIWVLGMGESLNNIALALGLITLGAVAASIGAWRISQMLPTSGKVAA